MAAASGRARPRAAGRDWFLLFPLLAPALLLAAGNDSFGFDPPGWLDAFMYVGYFWHYPEHLPLFDDNYKISRLPWILPGFVAQSLGGVVLGSLVLTYVTIVGGALALYLLVREALEDRIAAAVTAVAWGCCTWAHGIGGWNYHVVAAADYYLLGSWLIVRAARGRSVRLSATLAGACFAAAVHTHILFVAFAPLVAALYWACVPPSVLRPGARTVRAFALVGLGGLMLTAALGLVNRGTGGIWLFFLPQLEQALRLSRPGNNPWWTGNVGEWLPAARYLVLPLTFLLAGLVVPLRFWRDRERRPAVAFVILAWGALAIMCALQFADRQTVLDYNYMAFALYALAFPCAAATIAIRHDAQPYALATVALASVLITGTLLLFMPTPLPGFMDGLVASLGLGHIAPIVVPVCAGLIGAMVMFVVPVRARVATFALWFAIVNAWIAPAPSSYGIGNPGIRQEMLSLFRDADRFTTELDPTLVGIKYWISSESLATTEGPVALGPVFDSFVATRTWLTNLFARQSPGKAIGDLTVAHLDRAVCLGVLSSIERQAKLQEEIVAHYAGLERPLQPVASRRFDRGELSFALTVLKPVVASAVADGRPPCAAP